MKRETLHIFDLILKQLIRLSSVAVIQFINGLFGTDYPLDSTVEYPSTENVSRKLKRLMSDTVVVIGGLRVYHIEGEIGDDASMAVRVFEYGFAEGLRTKTMTDAGVINVRFPDARIIYWETTEKTPDEVILRLDFSDGSHYDYRVKTFKFLNCGIGELVERKMAILLPFYVLKLRKKVAAARTAGQRQKLSAEMRVILDELVASVERGAKAGLMSESDTRIVLEHTERLYSELYAQYEELAEVDVMLKDRILTYSEEAALKAAREATIKATREATLKTEKMAKTMLSDGLPVEAVVKYTSLPRESVEKLL
jgi:hypothetical protein